MGFLLLFSLAMERRKAREMLRVVTCLYGTCFAGKMQLRLKVTHLSWRLWSVFVEEAICISFLIFRIRVSAEESRQASDNFIVVMKHVSGHSDCDLWFQGIFEAHDFVDKTCSCGMGRGKGWGREVGKREGHLAQVEWLRAAPEILEQQRGIFLWFNHQFRAFEQENPSSALQVWKCCWPVCRSSFPLARTLWSRSREWHLVELCTSESSVTQACSQVSVVEPMAEDGQNLLLWNGAGRHCPAS